MGRRTAGRLSPTASKGGEPTTDAGDNYYDSLPAAVSTSQPCEDDDETVADNKGAADHKVADGAEVLDFTWNKVGSGAGEEDDDDPGADDADYDLEDVTSFETDEEEDDSQMEYSSGGDGDSDDYGDTDGEEDITFVLMRDGEFVERCLDRGVG